MKKPTPKPEQKFNFWLLASLVLVALGLLIATWTPQIISWRSKLVDKLVAESNTQNTLGYLKAAHALAPTDSVATEALAKYYARQGSGTAVLATYEQGIKQPNQIYLGNLALSLQQYDQALQHFYVAERQQPSAASLSGQAAVLFNLGRVEEGCVKAGNAQKLNLNNTQAAGMLQICNLLKANPNEGSRADAQLLVQNQIARVGEKWLLATNVKTPNDWLNLARLAAARGDAKLAITRAEEGIKLDQASLQLNEVLVQYYKWAGDSSNAQKYQRRAQQLEFEAWQ
ncbi:hypothetical protein HYX70_01830 [Candidatus Saccharibacteria bacterium]|nr:hypothetical protein [Candidatus Saccharibacteria bacterium]